MNVLILTREQPLAEDLTEWLSRADCNTVGIHDGSPMADLAVSVLKVDVAILDLAAPHHAEISRSAIELRRNYGIPSVVLLPENRSEAIPKALQVKPLAYLLSPVCVDQMVLMVDVVRRCLGRVGMEYQQPAHQSVRLGSGFIYNRHSRGLFHNGAPVDLTSSELKLFELCLRRQGSVVPYEVIAGYVWNGKVVAESTRRGLYYRLRKKLNNRLFETISGLGCRIKLNTDEQIDPDQQGNRCSPYRR